MKAALHALAITAAILVGLYMFWAFASGLHRLAVTIEIICERNEVYCNGPYDIN